MLNVSGVFVLKAELKLSSVGQLYFLSNDSFCSNRSISLIFDEYLVSSKRTMEEAEEEVYVIA